MNALIRSTIVVLAPLAIAVSLSSIADAQCASCQRSAAPYASWMPATAAVPTTVFSPTSPCLSCGGGQEYKLVYQTVYDQREMTAWRIENETVYEDRTVTSYKPVWEPQTRERRYRVAKPVVETSAREEQYTVMKPVWETQVRDCSYDRVRWESVACEREQRTMVARPVYETAERDESYTVMRPVCQTTYRTQYRTVMQPVATCQTRLVDQGCFVNQMVMKPSPVTNRLGWQSGQSVCDPVTGQVVYQRPGLYWQPVQQGRYEVNRVWQPNVVAQQVQQTALVPQTVTEQVPVQSMSYQPEQVVRKVPYTVCRMVQEEVVQKIPYTVMRPVTEHIENKVPIQVCRMVPEQCVRRIPITTTRMVYEDRVEQQTVQVCRMVPVQQTVRVPHCVEKRVPVTYTYYTPRVVCQRIPLDACGNPIEAPLVPQAEPSAATQEPVTAPAQEEQPAAAAESTFEQSAPAAAPTPAAPTPAAPASPRTGADAADVTPRLDSNATSPLGVGPTDLRANVPETAPAAEATAPSSALETAPAWNGGTAPKSDAITPKAETTLPKAGSGGDWRSKLRPKAAEPTKADELDKSSTFGTPTTPDMTPKPEFSIPSLREDRATRSTPAPLDDVRSSN